MNMDMNMEMDVEMNTETVKTLPIDILVDELLHKVYKEIDIDKVLLSMEPFNKKILESSCDDFIPATLDNIKDSIRIAVYNSILNLKRHLDEGEDDYESFCATTLFSAEASIDKATQTLDLCVSFTTLISVIEIPLSDKNVKALNINL